MLQHNEEFKSLYSIHTKSREYKCDADLRKKSRTHWTKILEYETTHIEIGCKLFN